jgi:mono/diheme cytochrome c family protein
MRILLTTVTLAALTATAGMAADAKAGQASFDKSCKSCHGSDGTPNPAIAKMMKVDMKALGSAGVQAKSDTDIKKVIDEGVGKMKPIKTVTGADADNVVAFIRTLKK